MRVHGWMYIYMKGHASIHIYVYTCRYTYEYICTNIHQPTRTYTHKKSKHTHTHTHLHVNNYILEHIIIYIYSRLQISWPRILWLFLKTFNVVAGVPGFSWELSLVPLLRGINHKFHVQNSGSFKKMYKYSRDSVPPYLQSHIYILMYINMYIYKYLHIYIYMYIYIYM